jgi:serine/threonine-protein kinase
VIMIGRTVSHYRIVDKIGEGGMGEVYRARDERLDRDVAIKVLPEAVAQDPERLARFEREAKLLASLSHQNVATLYGLEVHEGQRFLVMELAEGETLAERIKKGPLAIDDALDYALQIAEGLEAAHERGIIHRDLKPANVMVSPEGQVKVLDFGLAKVWHPDESNADLTHSPTLTGQMTTAGVLLGTAAYMSPEQARGKLVDKRADIWAFGCVFYELLTGEKAFEGEAITDVLARIIEREPDWELLPDSLPRRIRELLIRCLRKDPQERLRDIGDARLDLQVHDEANQVPKSETETQQSRVWSLAGTAAALVILSAISFWVGTRWGGDTKSAEYVNGESVTKTEITLPSEANLGFGLTYGFDPTLIALSPDGSKLAFVGRTEEGTQLYLRHMDDYEVRSLPGTEDAIHPFFSPDGVTVGFLTLDKVKKVSLSGGGAITLCDARTAVRATWVSDGSIYFGENEGSVLSRVSEGGGPPEILIAREGTFSAVLPSGEWALFSDIEIGMSGYASLYAVSLRTKERKLLLERGYDARYVPTGHLVFARQGTLMAVGFDPERVKVVGEPQPILSGASMDSFFSTVQATFSTNGRLAYCPGGDLSVGRIARIDRNHQVKYLDLPEGLLGVFDVSPNEEWLAVGVLDVQPYIQIFDLSRNVGRKLAAAEGRTRPVWSPNGRSIAFYSRTSTEWRVEIEEFDSGESEIIHRSAQNIRPDSFSPDGKWLAMNCGESKETTQGICYIETTANSEIHPLPFPDHGEWGPSFSPDGKWIAYSSDETGRPEIWVRSFPDGQRHYQISTGTGMWIEPLWCPSGELFFRSGGRWMVSRVETQPEFRWEPPEFVWETDYVDTIGLSYDVSRDGRYLYVVKSVHKPDPSALHVVTNWFAELNRLVPTE